MQKEIKDLKNRLKSLESESEQNKIKWNQEREKHKKTLTAKGKEEALMKSEIQQLNDILRQSKERDNKQVESVNKRNLELEVKLKELKAELEDKKRAMVAQDQHVSVIQKRLGKIKFFFKLLKKC